MALVLAASLLLRSVPAEGRPLALGVLALAVPIVFGAVFGSPVTLVTLLLCAAWSLPRRPVPAGAFLGVAAATAGPAWPVVPFLLFPGGAERTTGLRRALTALVLALAALCLPAFILDPRAFASALTRTDAMAPGLGLVNLVLYRGAENEPAARVLFAAVPLLALAIVGLLLGRLPRAAPEGRAALAVLAVLFLMPSVSPEAVAMPILLAALPFLRTEELALPG